MVAAAGVDAGPFEHLVDSLLRTTALKLVYEQMVAGFDVKAAADLASSGIGHVRRARLRSGRTLPR